MQEKYTNIFNMSPEYNAFKDLKAQNKLLLEISQDGIFLENIHGDIIECNSSAYAMYGYEKGEMIGLNIRDVVSKEIADELPREITEISGKNYLRSVGKKKDGTLFPIDVNTKFIYLKDKKYLIAFIKDMSEHVAYQQELISLNKQLLKEKMLLKKIADRDYLTGLYNRRKILELLEQSIEKSRNEEKNLCTAIIDVDHFKMINDNYGHLTGDKVLVELSKLFKNILDEDMHCGRYGGEEFLIVLPDKKLEDAILICEELRSKVASARFDEDISFTISTGIVQACDCCAEQIIKRADDLLFIAKRSGKNTIRY